MSLPRTSLIDAQNALSHLHFAVSQEVEGIGNYGVNIGYHPFPGLGLYLEIEVKAKDSQELSDRLNHGALSGEYDYRFTCGRELSDDPERYVKVTAYPRMFDHTEPLAASPTPNNDTLQGRGEVLRVELERQMETYDEELPSSLARQRGLTWLEGWFDLDAALQKDTRS